MKPIWIASLATILIASTLRAEDATQFRGAGGLGVSKETNLPTKWSPTEGLRWKAELPGKGLSNPVVAGGRVYVTVTAAYQQKREAVLCFDVKTGKKLWERQVWATGATLCHPKTNMAAPTPITDGERVYALFATGDFVCYDKDGDLVWYRSIVGDYPTVGNNVGMAASPTVHGDLIIVCMENVGESFAAGIDKNTGENRWRVTRPRGINWVSPLVIQNNGQPEVLFQSGEGLDAHDVATGKKKWGVPKLTSSAFASVTASDGILFVHSSKFAAVRPGKTPEAKAEVLWESLKVRLGYCSPVAHQGLVYGVTNAGIVNCVDARTGTVLWNHRLEGTFAASPMIADGNLYVVNEKGVTTILKSARELEVIATNPINDTILATPVASDGAIFLRSDGALYCIGKK